MANTVIQLKYSQVNATPTSLNIAEPAYSYVSNTFFIGSPTGTGVIPIGGKFYLDQQQAIYDTANAAYAAANSGSSSAGAYNQANAAFATANSAAIYANGAFAAVNALTGGAATDGYARRTANSAFYHANAAFDKANTACSAASNAQSDATQALADASNAYNAAIAAQYNASGAFDQANAAFSTANGTVAVNLTQNNSITAAFAAANGAVAVNLTQNNSISAAFNSANAAYANANSYITYNEAVNVTQNTNITNAQNSALSAFNQANAAYAAANVSTGVNLTQNNSIAFASDTANAAYANANSYITYNEAVNAAQNSRISAAYTRANNSLSANNGGTVTGDVSITGNLIVTGNVISISTTEIVANDSLIILGLGNYTSDIVDIGFAGHYNNGTNAHAGIIRDSTNKEFYVFDGYTQEIGANNNIDPSDSSFHIATVNANLKSQSVRVKNIDLLPYANGIYDTANAAFLRANNSLDANNGGTVTGNVNFTGSLKPTSDVTWNLGSATNRWHSLFVGSGTIDIGGLTIKNTSVNSTDTALIGGVQDLKLPDAAVGSFRQLTNTANAAFDSANAAYANANSYITYAEAVNVRQNNNIIVALNTANAAYTRANNSLNANSGGSVSGTVGVTANIIADYVVANTGFASSAGSSKLTLGDIGLVTIDVAGVQTKFGASGIENSQGIYGGSFGGNRLSLNSETNLISNRGDVVKIQTGTNGTAVNEFVFSNNSLSVPGGITANGFTAGGINVVPTLASSYNTANAAFNAANGAVAVNNTQNTNITYASNQSNSAFYQANAAFYQANAAFAQSNAAFNQANTDFTNVSISAGNYGTASAVASFRVEANGRITSANNTAIAISADAITSGTLPVGRGGSGATTFTNNGVLLGQGTSAFTTASSSTEGHVLTINASGVPTFTYLQGGTF